MIFASSYAEEIELQCVKHSLDALKDLLPAKYLKEIEDEFLPPPSESLFIGFQGVSEESLYNLNDSNDLNVFFPESYCHVHRKSKYSKIYKLNLKKHILQKHDEVIVVYGYGKVAGTAIYNSLKTHQRCGKSRGLVYKAHHMEQVFERNLFERNGSVNYYYQTIGSIYDKYEDSFNWSFVMGVRDPIQQSISTFFQIANPSQAKSKALLRKYVNYFTENLIINFEKIYLKRIKLRLGDLNRFQGKEIWIQQGDNQKTIIYKYEFLNESYSDIANIITGCHDAELNPVNVTSKKTIY